MEETSIREEKNNYDLMRVFVLRLGERGEKSGNQAIRLLSGLLSPEKTAEEKKKMLTEDFHIDVTEEIDREVSSMCNLSTGIFEKGMEAGIAQGMEAGIAQGMEAGIARGMEAGRLEALFDLVEDGTLTILKAAEKAKMESSEFERRYEENRK